MKQFSQRPLWNLFIDACGESERAEKAEAFGIRMEELFSILVNSPGLETKNMKQAQYVIANLKEKNQKKLGGFQACNWGVGIKEKKMTEEKFERESKGRKIRKRPKKKK